MSKLRGWYLTFWWIGVAVVIIASTIREMSFYYDQTVVRVKSAEEVKKLKDNMVAEISLPLDVKQAYPIEFIVSKDEMVLIPFAGVGYQLMWVVQGQMTEREMSRLRPPFKGRVVEESGTRWDVYEKRLKLKELFYEKRVRLPENTMLIYDAPRKFPSGWHFFILACAIGYLGWKAYSLVRWVGRKAEL